jgi:hypothetical protein
MQLIVDPSGFDHLFSFFCADFDINSSTGHDTCLNVDKHTSYYTISYIDVALHHGPQVHVQHDGELSSSEARRPALGGRRQEARKDAEQGGCHPVDIATDGGGD